MDSIPTLLDLPEQTVDKTNVSNPIARVVLDTNQLGLVKPLDYLVPEHLDDVCQVGAAVRVRVGPRLLAGVIMERGSTTSYSGKLKSISSMVTNLRLLNENQIRLIEKISLHYGVFPAQILRFVLPKVHQQAQDEFINTQVTLPSPSSLPSQSSPTSLSTATAHPHWEPYEGGQDYAHALGQGQLQRAVWTTLPHPSALAQRYSWVAALFELVVDQLRAGKQVLLVVPTLDHVLELAAQAREYLQENSPDLVSQVGTYHSLLGEKSQYLTYLRAMSGHLGLIIGARACAWLPLANPGLLVIVDPVHVALRETKNPQITARQVLLYRSQIERCSLLIADYTVSAADYQLVKRGWARPLAASRQLRRQLGGRVQIFDSLSAQKEGPNSSLTLPGPAITLARKALQKGPVLVHAPFSGYHQVIACATCGMALSCRFCRGPLERRTGNNLVCKWCSRLYTEDNVCLECGSAKRRVRSVGIGPVGEELGRLFPQIPVMVSSNREGKLADLDAARRVVVALPGAEPPVPGGYAAGLILQPQALDGRTELWVPREVIRRFLHAAALLRPAAPLLIAGPIRPGLDQFLIRTDVWAAADAQLQQLQETGFPPARRIAVLRGQPEAINFAQEYLRTHFSQGELLGPILDEVPPPRQVHTQRRPQSSAAVRRSPGQYQNNDTDLSNVTVQARLLVRCSLKDGPDLGRTLRNLQLTWHAQHGSGLSISIDPDNPT